MLDEEQLLLELINRARANPAAEASRLGIDLNDDLLPGTLSAAAKQPLAPQQILIDVAAAHSQDMLDRDFFAHVNPDGDGPGERIAEAGYAARSWGENLAFDVDVVHAHDLLFQSAGHRVNLLRDSFREIGIGVRDDGFWGVMVTEVFASRAGDAFLTGVAFLDGVVADEFFTPGEGLGGATITATGRDRGSMFTTTTGPTGAYALRVPPDTYVVTAAGGQLGRPMAMGPIVVQTQNVKLDFRVPENEPVDPPQTVAVADRSMTGKNEAVVIDVLANDFAPVGFHPATVTIVSPPGAGRAVADPLAGRIIYTPAADWTGLDEFTYQVQDASGVWTPPGRVSIAVVDRNHRPWQNPLQALDVNADGRITPLDVLIVVNDLNNQHARPLPAPSPLDMFPAPYLDVNGDDQVDPQDVVILVNWVNAATTGEGESSSPVVPQAFQATAEKGDWLHNGLDSSPTEAAASCGACPLFRHQDRRHNRSQLSAGQTVINPGIRSLVQHSADRDGATVANRWSRDMEFRISEPDSNQAESGLQFCLLALP